MFFDLSPSRSTTIEHYLYAFGVTRVDPHSGNCFKGEFKRNLSHHDQMFIVYYNVDCIREQDNGTNAQFRTCFG